MENTARKEEELESPEEMQRRREKEATRKYLEIVKKNWDVLVEVCDKEGFIVL